MGHLRPAQIPLRNSERGQREDIEMEIHVEAVTYTYAHRYTYTYIDKYASRYVGMSLIHIYIGILI